MILLVLATAGLLAADLPPPPSGSGLSLPAMQPCLDGGSAPTGLAAEDVAIGLAGVHAAFQKCLAGATDGVLSTDVTVACAGRVDAVMAYEGSGFAPDAIACVMDALYYAPFPAHDRPGGHTVPVEVRPGRTTRALAPVSLEAPIISAPRNVAIEASRCDDRVTQRNCDTRRDQQACTAWATALLDRQGSCHDPSLARQKLALACTTPQSPATGCALLGRAFEEGTGGERDRTSAARYYAWACDRGAAEACESRGRLLERGIGVRRNDAKALASHEAGCALGNAQSCYRVGVLHDRSPTLPRDKAAAILHYDRACAAGLGVACVGAGVVQESQSAFLAAQASYEAGIEIGTVEAKRRLSRLLWHGLGSKPDRKRARLLASEACQEGDIHACRGPRAL